MDFNFKDISPYEQRLKHFEDSEIVSRLDKAKASVLAPKAKDCQRQLNEASSVWSVDRKRFLFIFSDVNEDGLQKVSVWGMKSPGDYQRIKTLWVSCYDYIIEAVVMFLIEFFELFILTKTYTSDVPMLYDIEKEIRDSLRYKPFNLKHKMKLLKAWGDIMPRFNKMVAELDERITVSLCAITGKGKSRMKTFLQDKGATYNEVCNFTVAVRKDYVEYYLKLKKGHAVANIEIFGNAVRISILCRQFADEFFGKVLRDGIAIDHQTNPKLAQLINEDKYTILTDRTGDTPETHIFLDIEKVFPSWLDAMADKEVRKEFKDMILYFLDLRNELATSSSPSLKALSRHFHD